MSSQVLLSPAELAYLHSSLKASPSIRPDLRKAREFRPLIAETGILPSANGSARICFNDGTEALVGVKAELERTPRFFASAHDQQDSNSDEGDDDDVQMKDSLSAAAPKYRARTDPSWLEVSLNLPGHRDDDQLPIFLSSMLTESLLSSSSTLTPRLRLNSRWHWKLYIDLVLLSAPLSYPLPLLSMATHLALMNTILPRRTSDREDDPLFDDDWDAGYRLFELDGRPPISLLVITAKENIIFDPSKEELAVADMVVAVSLAPAERGGVGLKVLSVRTIDPPSRMTPLGLPNSATEAQDSSLAGGPAPEQKSALTIREELTEEKSSVWSPARGGLKRSLLTQIIQACAAPGGIGDEVLEGLASVAT